MDTNKCVDDVCWVTHLLCGVARNKFLVPTKFFNWAVWFLPFLVELACEAYGLQGSGEVCSINGTMDVRIFGKQLFVTLEVYLLFQKDDIAVRQQLLLECPGSSNIDIFVLILVQLQIWPFDNAQSWSNVDCGRVSECR